VKRCSGDALRGVYLREELSGMSYLENQSELRAATADAAAHLLDAAIAARTVPGQRQMLLYCSLSVCLSVCHTRAPC